MASNNALKFAVLCIVGGILVFALAQVKDENKGIKDEENLITKTEKSGNASSCPDLTFVGDGFCDDNLNIEECEFDLGDCCKASSDRILCKECLCKSKMTYYHENASLFQELCPQYYDFDFGDGICDIKTNVEECFFDVGDCCYDDIGICVKSTNYCIEELVGDGICHDFNNGPLCEYDGGDCCMIGANTSLCWNCSCKYTDPSLSSGIGSNIPIVG